MEINKTKAKLPTVKSNDQLQSLDTFAAAAGEISKHQDVTPKRDNRSDDVKNKIKKVSIVSMQSISSISMPSGIDDSDESNGNEIRTDGRFNIDQKNTEKNPPKIPRR